MVEAAAGEDVLDDFGDAHVAIGLDGDVDVDEAVVILLSSAAAAVGKTSIRMSAAMAARAKMRRRMANLPVEQ